MKIGWCVFVDHDGMIRQLYDDSPIIVLCMHCLAVWPWRMWRWLTLGTTAALPATTEVGSWVKIWPCMLEVSAAATAATAVSHHRCRCSRKHNDHHNQTTTEAAISTTNTKTAAAAAAIELHLWTDERTVDSYTHWINPPPPPPTPTTTACCIVVCNRDPFVL